MKKKELKKILLNYYKEPSVFAILNGTRKPSYEVMLKLNQKYNVPFEAWVDIKSYINNTDNQTSTSSTEA